MNKMLWELEENRVFEFLWTIINEIFIISRWFNNYLVSWKIQKESEKVNLINFEIWRLENTYDYKFLPRFKDIIFHEFWLDNIDVTWDAVEETLTLLNLVMIKK